MSERQWCSGRTWGGRMGWHGCSSKPTSTHDGKPYCHVHDPVKAAARRDKANAKWRAEQDSKDRKRKLDEAVRLTADAVVKAADLAFSHQMTERDADIMEVPLARIARAVLAHRKALAEQAKEASRG